MLIHFGDGHLRAEWNDAVACVGVFDGVHLGHQALIRSAAGLASATERPCVLATFDRHPAAVLHPDRCPPSIASLQSNLRQFEELGVAVSVVLPFDRALSETSADAFLTGFLVDKLRAAAIVIGKDFAFGRGREGTPAWLGGRIETHVIPPFEVDGRRVSSSAIREAIKAGDVETASRLLGRPFEISGVVVTGARLGRELGFPTINLARSFEQVVVADGIYGGYADTPKGTFRAAISIGARPTVDEHRTIEAHLIDYPGDSLYGCAVRLFVATWVRPIAQFDNLAQLKRQIASDVKHVSAVLQI